MRPHVLPIFAILALVLTSCRFDPAGISPDTGEPADASPAVDTGISIDAALADASPCAFELAINGLTGDARSVAPDHTPTVEWQALPACVTSLDIAVGTAPMMDDVTPFTSLDAILDPSVTTSYRIVHGIDGFTLDLQAASPGYYITLRADDGQGPKFISSQPFRLRPVPEQVSAPAVWLDSSEMSSLFQDTGCSTPVDADDQPVACWANRGSGANAVAAVDALRYPGADQGLVARDDHMVVAGLFAGTLTDVSVWLVQREDAESYSFDFNLNHPVTGGARYSAHVPWAGSAHRIFWDAGSSRLQTANDVVNAGETHIFGLVNSMSLGQQSIHVDGTVLQSGAVSLAANASDFCFGLDALSTIYEVLVIAPTPARDDIEHLEGYLACKWDLRHQLAPSHLYYNAIGTDDTGCP